MTFIPRSEPDVVTIASTPDSGLEIQSVVRLDKIATLDSAVITGKLGGAPPEWLHNQRATFFGVFGVERI